MYGEGRSTHSSVYRASVREHMLTHVIPLPPPCLGASLNRRRRTQSHSRAREHRACWRACRGPCSVCERYRTVQLEHATPGTLSNSSSRLSGVARAVGWAGLKLQAVWMRGEIGGNVGLSAVKATIRHSASRSRRESRPSVPSGDPIYV